MPDSYQGEAKFHVSERLLAGLPWQKVYDFCERLYSHLAQDVSVRDEEGDFYIGTPQSEVHWRLRSQERVL